MLLQRTMPLIEDATKNRASTHGRMNRRSRKNRS
jgi:hypothetical protein